jgi:hypothetical protein
MVNNFNFKDYIVIKQTLSDSQKSDAATMLNKDRQAKLKVEIDATQSGVIINNRVYPGMHVKDSYRTFFSKEKGGLADYDKPILTHHDMDKDPIGRIVNAKFSQIKYGNDFDTDFLKPEKAGEKGSGLVTITGIITDPDAIAKIVDARYLSVSAGHSSRYILCSTCGDSIMECDHYPGRTYNDEGEPDEDGEMCFAITGPLTYHETSFVNLPASPIAGVKNFTWTDSKDSWQDDNCITSQVEGRKGAVRSFTLIDEDGEISLLTGKSKSSKKKTVVAVSPAIADKLKHVMSSDQSEVGDESSNDHPPDESNTSEVLDVERNLDKANDLDNKQSNEELTMEKEFEELKNELQGLKDELTTAETKVTDLEKEVQAKDSQIERLTNDSQGMQDKMSNILASSIASARSRFGKPLPKGEDGEEITMDQYVTKLAERSVESLQDTLSDLVFEVDQLPVEVVNTEPAPAATPASEIVSEDKVSDPTPKEKGNAPKESKSKPAQRAIDKFSKGLLN